MDEFGTEALTDDEWATFAAKLHYVPQSAGPEALAEAVSVAERELGDEVFRLHYLSVPPKAALAVINVLRSADLVQRSRVIMEKPFGNDLESAVALNAKLHETFTESQIFRIDHFLGKEPAQNIPPSGLPMAFSSRSGVAISSTTCRSTFPRPWDSIAGLSSTNRPVPTRTWW